MSDLVKRARELARGMHDDLSIGDELADHIDALEAENKALRDWLLTSEGWLAGWAQHVGNCKGGNYCTCGLTAVRYEARALLAKGAK